MNTKQESENQSNAASERHLHIPGVSIVRQTEMQGLKGAKHQQEQAIVLWIALFQLNFISKAHSKQAQLTNVL